MKGAQEKNGALIFFLTKPPPQPQHSLFSVDSTELGSEGLTLASQEAADTKSFI